MTKYLINRILRSLLSVVIVVGVIMTMIYMFLDKQSIFANDPVFTKQKSNGKQIYMMQQWEQFGYLDYVAFGDFLLEEQKAGNIDQETSRLPFCVPSWTRKATSFLTTGSMKPATKAA